MDGKKDTLFSWKNLKKLAMFTAGAAILATPRDADAKRNDKIIPGKPDVDNNFIQNGGFPSDKIPSFPEQQPQDPAGVEVALALTVNGAEVTVTRSPLTDAALLAEIKGKLGLSPEDQVNTIIWSSPDIKLGDHALFEVNQNGLLKYAVKSTDKDGVTTITLFDTPEEAKFSLFPAKANVPNGATLREKPEVSGNKYKADGRVYTYTGVSQPDATVAGRRWYKLSGPDGEIRWASNDALGGDIKFTQKIDLTEQVQDKVEVAGLPADYPVSPDEDVWLTIGALRKDTNGPIQIELNKPNGALHSLDDSFNFENTRIELTNSDLKISGLLTGCVLHNFQPPTSTIFKDFCGVEIKQDGKKVLFIVPLPAADNGFFIIDNEKSTSGEARRKLLSQQRGTQIEFSFPLANSIPDLLKIDFGNIVSLVKEGSSAGLQSFEDSSSYKKASDQNKKAIQFGLVDPVSIVVNQN